MIFIAELGLNAHGDLEKMKRMCSKAADAGATLIKGQYYNPRRVLGADHPALQYALQCQFTRQEHEILARYCLTLGVPYFVSVFVSGDVAWAGSFGPVFKIASRMNRNREFIAKVEQQKKPTFMSIQPNTCDQRIPDRFKLMWCVREYPTSVEEVKKYPYNAHFGLSSHCPDPAATLYAASLGATVFENHLCESRDEEGCDIPSSITFEEYKDMIKEVRSMGIGDVRKRHSPHSAM